MIRVQSEESVQKLSSVSTVDAIASSATRLTRRCRREVAPRGTVSCADKKKSAAPTFRTAYSQSPYKRLNILRLCAPLALYMANAAALFFQGCDDGRVDDAW